MKSKDTHSIYLSAPIGSTMIKTALSMLPGTIAMSGYNIVDTYFVAKLGTEPLAAMGYTFPVIMLVNCIYRGLATGIMTTSAHSLGGKKHRKAARITSSGVLLIILASILISSGGLLTMSWTFRQFGASESILPLIREFMIVWYLGSLTSALGMTGNDLLIVAGTPKLASTMMIVGMGLNVILDPIFIFDEVLGLPIGLGMGIRGAAIATVLTQAVAALGVFAILRFKHSLLRFDIFKAGLIRSTWNKILRFALPASIGMFLLPIGNAITTWIVARFGDNAVAAVAAAGRIESLAFVFPMALGMSIIPMVAQNYGAGNFERINLCRRFSMRFAFLFELGMAAFFFIGADWLAHFFSSDPTIISIIALYLRIIPFGFGMMEIHRYGTFFFTGCNRPAITAWLNALRILGLLIPLSFLALYFHSLEGIFLARLTADVLSGATAFACARILTLRLLKEGKDKPLPAPPLPDSIPVDFSV